MKPSGIRAKLMLAITCIAVVLALVMMIGSSWFYGKELKDSIAKQHFAMLSMAADQLDSDITAHIELLATFGKQITAAHMQNPEAVTRILAANLDLQKVFEGGFLLLDRTGRIIAEFPFHPESVGKDMSLRDYASRTIATGKPYISTPYKDPVQPYHPVVTTAVPLKDASGRLFAVLAGHHDLLQSNHLARLSKVAIGSSGYLYIIDKSRTLVMHPDTKRILEHVPQGMNHAVDLAIAGGEGTIENVNSRTDKGLTSFKPLQGVHWIIVSHFPLEEAHLPIRNARQRFGLIAFIFVILTVGTVLLITRRMSMPLLALTEHVRCLPQLQGEARRVPVTSGDELGQLAQEFNTMLGRLDKQERFIRDILENTSSPLFVLDRNHRVLFWNRSLEIMTGMPKEQMVGTSFQWRPFYPSQRPVLADLVLDGTANGFIASYYGQYRTDAGNPGVCRAEGWYPNLNGRDRYLYFDASPVHDDEGRIIAVVETLHEITERKITEESLRLFSEAVEQSASAIVITDCEGIIQYVNRTFCTLTGYTKEEAIGQNPKILKSDRQGPEVYEELWKTIKSGQQWHGEFHNKRKNGSLYWELNTISPISDSNGVITNFLAIKDNISERKEMEYKLRKQQAELIVKHEQMTAVFQQVEKAKKEWEETMDCIGDILILADSENRIRRCNNALMKFAGIDFKDVLGKDWRDLFAAHFLDDAELGGEGATAMDIYHEPTGRWFSMNIYPYGNGTGQVITLHDMTDIKKVSRELSKAYDELKSTHMQMLQQEKLASIGQLAAGVAHEINNPMGFISSNLGTLGKYTERLHSFMEQQAAAVRADAVDDLATARKKLKIDYVLEDIPKLLTESIDGAERVRKIVQNLKSFSRIDQAEQQEADLNDCIDSTLSIAWNELKYKCTVEKEYGELPRVKCYPQQLNQVFLNLLVNASHAIEKEGVVKIRTWLQDEYAHIAVSDNGCGIPEEIRTRIFEPFFTTKEPGKGTGLGLSISYDIVQKHGGELSVASVVGSGTTFTIRLPVKGGAQ